jgi:hypothetical protein
MQDSIREIYYRVFTLPFEDRTVKSDMSDVMLGCCWSKRRIRPLSANHSSFSTTSDISDIMENILNGDDDNDDICVNECNGSTVVTLDNDCEAVEVDFEFTYVIGEEKSSNASQNE